MTPEQRDFWRNEMDQQRAFLDSKNLEWQRNVNNLNMRFEINGVRRLVKFSRMYPLLRQILVSSVIPDPRVDVKVKPYAERMPFDLKESSTRLEAAGQELIRLLGVKKHVTQMLIDAVVRSIGWGKMGYVASMQGSFQPYAINNSDQVGLPYFQWRPATNIGVDFMCPPHDLNATRYVMDFMDVPRQFVIDNPRYNSNKSQLPNGNVHPEVFADFGTDTLTTQLQGDFRNQSKANGEYVQLVEIHDRWEQKLITFAPGVPTEIEERDHPFRAVEPIEVGDPITGQERVVGFTPGEGSIFTSGVPFIPLKIDDGLEGFHARAPMDYVRDIENLTVESVSRRADLLKRFARLIAISRREAINNPDLEEQLKNIEDGDVVKLNDPVNGLSPVNWSASVPDQVSLEADLHQYEAETLRVDTLSIGGARQSATESAQRGAEGSMNREWILDRVGGVHTTVLDNSFRMFRDPRYPPMGLIADISRGDEQANFVALTQKDFLYEYNLSVHIRSGGPISSPANRELITAVYDRMVSSPNVDRVALDAVYLSAYEDVLGNPARLLKGGGRSDTIRLAQMENIVYLMRGQNPGVTPGEDHPVHITIHDPNNIAQSPEFQALPPEVQQMVMNVVLEHVQEHVQSIESQTSGHVPMSRSASGQVPANNLQQLVQSNAQEVAEQTTQGQGQLESIGA